MCTPLPFPAVPCFQREPVQLCSGLAGLVLLAFVNALTHSTGERWQDGACTHRTVGLTQRAVSCFSHPLPGELWDPLATPAHFPARHTQRGSNAWSPGFRVSHKQGDNNSRHIRICQYTQSLDWLNTHCNRTERFPADKGTLLRRPHMPSQTQTY